MRLAIAILVTSLAGCTLPHKPAPRVMEVTRRGPGPAYACLLPRLPAQGLRQQTEQTEDGWRMRIQMLVSPPTGWYDKGEIEYTAAGLRYVPNSATDGIGDARLGAALVPMLEICGGGVLNQDPEALTITART
ncbi:hypothetical protein [Tropicimonas sp. IMCC6043]|uniref:hypothetical protein n=1 Tax=Tropicimonas sp. IMCC6043 TaxID=2510645 RepID=UPI00101C0889|nr:hypothetical protein [Tropicimonas sp. IMCC6043]RYH12166.1 hypothetical protein EU800_00975 [Tropicimonas sp. IMCC6043]